MGPAAAGKAVVQPVDPIAKGKASDVGEGHQWDDGAGEAVEMGADGGVVEGGGHGGGNGMECRIGSGGPLGLEHGYLVG